ncbi:MAG: helix-turn-helix transcriptional regulator [Synergistaceae bacterium]|nr:helix-turn-helix transcriptional regulator [Synergistaceae bacterium]
MKETRKIEKYEQAVKNIRGLHSLRMNRGITQQKLSQLSGVSPDTIRNYECGTYLPTIRTYNTL